MATTYELIAKNVLGSDTATVTLSSIPSTFDDIILVMSVRTARSALTDSLNIKLNGSTSSYTWRRLEGNGSSASSDSGSTSSVVITNGDTSTASTFSSAEVYVPNYAGATNKSFSTTAVQETNATGASIEARAVLWSSTAAVASIEITSNNSANLKSGSSFYLYGITKA